MHCIKTCFWQPYTTLLLEEGDDVTIFVDRLATLLGYRKDCQMMSYGFSQAGIFCALLIISVLGLSGIFPGATTGWIMVGLGGFALTANTLMGNIKNRFICFSNYAVIGAVILGIGFAGAFGALSGMAVGIAVLIICLMGNCFGSYVALFNIRFQIYFNQKILDEMRKQAKEQAEEFDKRAKSLEFLSSL